MIKQHYTLWTIDSFRDPVFQPKPIKCLRFIRDKDQDYGELYELIPNRKSLFLFRANAEKSGELLVMKILPQHGESYMILRMVLLRKKIRGKYKEDKTIPFEFVLKEINEINI